MKITTTLVPEEPQKRGPAIPAYVTADCSCGAGWETIVRPSETAESEAELLARDFAVEHLAEGCWEVSA